MYHPFNYLDWIVLFIQTVHFNIIYKYILHSCTYPHSPSILLCKILQSQNTFLWSTQSTTIYFNGHHTTKFAIHIQEINTSIWNRNVKSIAMHVGRGNIGHRKYDQERMIPPCDIAYGIKGQICSSQYVGFKLFSTNISNNPQSDNVIANSNPFTTHSIFCTNKGIPCMVCPSGTRSQDITIYWLY